jgi:RsiW-degrading membrane proteinase PrsW (M82 family)
MKLFGKMLLPLLIIFIVLTIFILSATDLWHKYDIDKNVLLGANFLFMGIGLLVFFMQKNALSNKNPNVFIRSVIAGMMIKMFSTVLAVLAYVILVGPTYNKKGVFISLFMYLIYLAAEVTAISKLNSNKNV